MTTKEQAKAAIKNFFDKFQEKQPIRPALTGDGSSSDTCDVDGSAGWIWVRFDSNQNKATKVYGPAFRGYPQDIPILVGHKHPQDEVEQVLGFNTALYWQNLTDWILENYQTPKHGQSHGETGGDRVPVGMRNIVPGQVHQTSPSGTSVEAETFRYVNVGSLVNYPGESIDLSGYDPGLGNHRYVLIYINTTTNAIGSSASSIVTLPTPPDLPSVDAAWIPLAVVDLVNGAVVEDSHIYDWRVLFASIGDLPDHTHSGSGDGGASIIGLQELMFDAAAHLTLSGEAIYPYSVYHQLFVSGMYPSGDAVLSYIYPDPTYTDSAAQMLIIRPSAFGLYDTYTITVKHGTGNIWLSGAQDITLDESTDHLMLIWNGTWWCNIGGSAGGDSSNLIYSWSGNIHVPINAAIGDAITFTFDGIDTSLDHLDISVYQEGLGGHTHLALNGNDLGTFNTVDGVEQWTIFSADAAHVQSLTNTLQIWCTGAGPSGYVLKIIVTASDTSGGGGGAPIDAEYVVLSLDATLTDERVLTGGTGITLVDGGAGSTITINSDAAGNQSANTVYAGPTSGAAATPSFRALVAADIYPAVGVVLDLDFTGTDYDTKAKLNNVGVRMSYSIDDATGDSPFPTIISDGIPAGDANNGWTHVATKGWQPKETAGTDYYGPAWLIPLGRCANFEVAIEIDMTASAVTDWSLIEIGYISTSGHVGAYARNHDDSVTTIKYYARLRTNDGDDTFTYRYDGTIMTGAAIYTLKFRVANGCVSVWDDQDNAWHDYQSRQSVGVNYTAAYIFLQARGSTTRIIGDARIKSLVLTYNL